MIDILSVDNMRKSDAATIAAGTPGTELMMRAARGVFGAVSWKAPVAIVCGSGNNAGDGYALALCLNEAGIDCTIICVYDRYSRDGKYYYDKCVDSGVKIIHLQNTSDESSACQENRLDLGKYPTVVDCLLGTGFRGDVRADLADVIESINSSGAYIVSVDINSGLNGDTGMSSCCVHSDLTVSVGSYKPGHFLNMAKDVIKEKVNADIGIIPQDPSYKLIEESDIKDALGIRKNYSNKGTYGYIALIGGSTRYSGAIRLAYLANAAMRSGAGVVKVALPGDLVHDVASHILESTIFPLSSANRVMSTKQDKSSDVEVAYNPGEIDELISNVKTVAFGMGIGTGDGAADILRHLLTKYTGNLIIDADGLTLLSRIDLNSQRIKPRNLILTPHIKEFSRLTGMEISEILEDPIGIAREYAARIGAVVLLKGPSTIVTNGNEVYITDRGCPGMATAGSGDVLSGILAAVASYIVGNNDTETKNDVCLATAVAAYINGAAGEAAEDKYGSISLVASDTIEAIPYIMSKIIESDN
jgi:NAD(P)H-hydrate epimerase